MKRISTTSIIELYEYCKSRRSDKPDETLSVSGFMGFSHNFRSSRVKQSLGFVVEALKLLPKSIRRSSGCTGAPWHRALYIEARDQTYGWEVVDMLLSLGVALGVVTVTHPLGSVCDIPYIVIEDRKATRLCKLDGQYHHARWED